MRRSLQAFPEFANRAKALRDAQRAWIRFRDAECGLAYAVWARVRCGCSPGPIAGNGDDGCARARPAHTSGSPRG